MRFFQNAVNIGIELLKLSEAANCHFGKLTFRFYESYVFQLYKEILLPNNIEIIASFQGDRYALVIIKPRSRDGLRRLAADLAGLPPSRLSNLLQEKKLDLKIPGFSIETTTKPVAALAKV